MSSGTFSSQGEAQEERGPRLRILSVEDDMLVAMGTNGMLEDLGHEVLEATSGAGALEILRSAGKIDLLITDHGMPGMTGIELARAVLQDRADLPIILTTGYMQLPQSDGLKLLVLPKPFREFELAAAIREALLDVRSITRLDERG